MLRRLLLLLTLLVSASPSWAAAYYMSAAGSDSNNGTSTGTPWLTPDHAVNCGDTITAAAGAYPAQTSFGTVTCPAGNNVAWLICATFDGCKINVTSGGQYSTGLWVSSNYWGVQGWEVSTYAQGGTCFWAYPPTSSANIHHIIFANDIANGCGSSGFQASANGSAGVDYYAVVGSIAYNSAQANYFCFSGINVGFPAATDSLAGTHFFLAGNFAWGNVEPNPCNGTPPTDGQGLFFDSISPYPQQMVIENNISIFNGGSGIKAYANATGSPNAKMYLLHNTTYGNETGGVNGGICAEISLQSSLSTEVYLNLSGTAASTGCSGPSALYVLGTVSADSTDVLYSNYGYSAAGNNISASGATVTGNTFSNPSFPNPVNPGAPSCGTYSSVPACMATVIANFKPTAMAALAYGYQVPSTTSVFDPLFPQWLCNVNLPTGLVSPGCLTASALSGATMLGVTIH